MGDTKTASDDTLKSMSKALSKMKEDVKLYVKAVDAGSKDSNKLVRQCNRRLSRPEALLKKGEIHNDRDGPEALIEDGVEAEAEKDSEKHD